MTQQIPNDEVDTALILEGELKRRVSEVVEKVVVNIIGKIIHEEMNKYKAEMLMEVCIAVGKTMQVIENEGRKPLWEAKPEDFGITHEELNRSHMEEDTDYAIR
jgi:hypothetical protein